ncbi:MAG TPA: dTMP kinase [Vicinamibacteria bacterium]
MAFLTFEGLEGCGKSTQARRLAEALGPAVVFTQEPGGTALGRDVRSLLLEHTHHDMAPAAEVLLYFADRAQHVAEVVRPALAAGRLVISDRYVDSSYAYQGYGRGLSLDLLRAVFELATGGLVPDLTVYLDVPVDEGLARARARGRPDRLESEERAFHERVREGYRSLIAADPQRWLVVDGCGDADAVFRAVRAAIEERLPLALHALP